MLLSNDNDDDCNNEDKPILGRASLVLLVEDHDAAVDTLFIPHALIIVMLMAIMMEMVIQNIDDDDGEDESNDDDDDAGTYMTYMMRPTTI